VTTNIGLKMGPIHFGIGDLGFHAI